MPQDVCNTYKSWYQKIIDIHLIKEIYCQFAVVAWSDMYKRIPIYFSEYENILMYLVFLNVEN